MARTTLDPEVPPVGRDVAVPVLPLGFDDGDHSAFHFLRALREDCGFEGGAGVVEFPLLRFVRPVDSVDDSADGHLREELVQEVLADGCGLLGAERGCGAERWLKFDADRPLLVDHYAQAIARGEVVHRTRSVSLMVRVCAAVSRVSSSSSE